jgi:hypothetical protein
MAKRPTARFEIEEGLYDYEVAATEAWLLERFLADCYALVRFPNIDDDDYTKKCIIEDRRAMREFDAKHSIDSGFTPEQQYLDTEMGYGYTGDQALAAQFELELWPDVGILR